MMTSKTKTGNISKKYLSAKEKNGGIVIIIL